jgi:hypothetical protein
MLRAEVTFVAGKQHNNGHTDKDLVILNFRNSII